MGTVTTAFLAVLALAIALWMIVRKKSKKIASWLMLIAGIFLGGLVGGIVGSVIGSIRGAAGSAVGGLTGLGAGAVLTVLAIIVTLELWHGIHPKKGKPSGFHPWLALAAPTLFVAAGGVFAKAIGLFGNVAATVGTHATTFLGG